MRNFIILLFCVLLAFACSGCRTVVSNIGDGAIEYREIQGTIREGETELAVTGTIIEQTSGYINERIGELEQSIEASTGAEQELGEILQRIRERPVNNQSGEGQRDIKIDPG